MLLGEPKAICTGLLTHVWRQIGLHITLFQLAKTLLVAQHKLAKTKRLIYSRPGIGWLQAWQGSGSWTISRWLALSTFLGSTFLCVGRIQVGASHKAEKWPLALSLYPLLSATPMKRGLLPIVPKRAQNESYWTIVGRTAIPAPIPRTGVIECADWTVLGPVHALRLSHTHATWTSGGGGRDGSSKADQGVATSRRNGFRARQGNKCPLPSSTLCRAHLGKCCSTAFTITSSKIPEKAFLGKGLKCPLKRIESLTISCQTNQPFIHEHFTGVASSLPGFPI